jgi:hypothetical protein
MSEKKEKNLEDLLRLHFAVQEAETRVPAPPQRRKSDRREFYFAEYAVACVLFFVVLGVYPISIQERQVHPQITRIVSVLTDERAIGGANQLFIRFLQDFQQHFGAGRVETTERSIL